MGIRWQSFLLFVQVNFLVHEGFIGLQHSWTSINDRGWRKWLCFINLTVHNHCYPFPVNPDVVTVRRKTFWQYMGLNEKMWSLKKKKKTWPDTCSIIGLLGCHVIAVLLYFNLKFSSNSRYNFSALGWRSIFYSFKHCLLGRGWTPLTDDL